MNELEKEIGNNLGLKYYFNIQNSDCNKNKKALEQSRAIGKIIDTAYDRNNNLTNEAKALYFKDGIEVSKFMYAITIQKKIL